VGDGDSGILGAAERNGTVEMWNGGSGVTVDGRAEMTAAAGPWTCSLLVVGPGPLWCTGAAGDDITINKILSISVSSLFYL
jgi:hypothetical protein